MSDYTKTVDFAAKDALVTGNPSKLVSGTELNTEFDNIATAVATKMNSLQRGVNNGVASLDNTGKVPSSQIPAVALTTSNSNLTIQKGTPVFIIYDNNGPTNQKCWWFELVLGHLHIRTLSDDQLTAQDIMVLTRSGMTVTDVTINATTVNINGTLKVNGTTVTVP